MPLTVFSAMWFSKPASFAGHFSASRSSPLFELRLRSEYYPALPSRSVATNQLLSWAFAPYSTSGIRGSLHAGLPARHVPPSGFAYPLDGLHPLIPCRFCFAPAALMGFTLRSFLLSQGIRCSSHPDEPTYRSTCRCSRRRSDGPAQTGLGSWVSTLPRVPGDRQVFNSPIAGCSLGFLPFQGSPLTTSFEPSPELLSRASRTRRLLDGLNGAPESQSVVNWPYPRDVPKHTRRTRQPS
jgi:hypothetical protein